MHLSRHWVDLNLPFLLLLEAKFPIIARRLSTTCGARPTTNQSGAGIFQNLIWVTFLRVLLGQQGLAFIPLRSIPAEM